MGRHRKSLLFTAFVPRMRATVLRFKTQLAK